LKFQSSFITLNDFQRQSSAACRAEGLYKTKAGDRQVRWNALLRGIAENLNFVFTIQAIFTGETSSGARINPQYSITSSALRTPKTKIDAQLLFKRKNSVYLGAVSA
jgi:hypothetical protein